MRIELFEHSLVVAWVFCHFACAPLFRLLAHKIQVLVRSPLWASARETLSWMLLSGCVLVPTVAPRFRFAATILSLGLAMITWQVIGLLLWIKAVKGVNSRVDLKVLDISLLGPFQLGEGSGDSLLCPAAIRSHLASVVVYLDLVAKDLAMQTHRLTIKHAVIRSKVLLLMVVQHREQLLLIIQDLFMGSCRWSIAWSLAPLKNIAGGLSSTHFQLRLGLLLLLIRPAVSLLKCLSLDIVLFPGGGLRTLGHVLALVVRKHRALVNALDYCFRGFLWVLSYREVYRLLLSLFHFLQGGLS